MSEDEGMEQFFRELRAERAERRRILIVDWAELPHWSAYEGVCLVHDQLPREDMSIGKSPKIFPQELSGIRDKEYYLRLAQHCIDTAQLSTVLKPYEFLDWAASVNLEYHLDWKHAVERSAATVSGVPQSTGPELIARPDTAGPPIGETGLRDNDELKTREKGTLLKLVIGIAVEQYGYDQDVSRGEAVKNIASDLERVGLSLDRKTIRKWLTEAAELLPRDITEK